MTLGYCDPCYNGGYYGGQLGRWSYPYGYNCTYGWPNNCYDPCWGYGNYSRGLRCYDPCNYPCLSSLDNFWAYPCQSYQRYQRWGCYDPCCYRPRYQGYQQWGCYDPCGSVCGWGSKKTWDCYPPCYPKKWYGSSASCGPC